jgi:hypothetical protein
MRPLASSFVLGLVLTAMGQSKAAEIEPSHADNDLYATLLRDGTTLAGTRVDFPAPLLREGQTPEDEKKALRTIAGSDGAVKELVRDSVTAPHIIKVRDLKGSDGTIIRLADVWFVVRGDLDAFDPAQTANRNGGGRPVEAGNMRFATRLLGDDVLKAAGIRRSNVLLEFYTHMTGDMLDRIHLEATDRERASRSKDSWVFASRTDPRFDNHPDYPNQWWPLAREKPSDSTPKPAGKPERFEGGASITRIGRLVTVPGALLIESHIAFAEPHAWFKGEPILRSKFNPVAQSQIRELRKKLAEEKSRSKP